MAVNKKNLRGYSLEALNNIEPIIAELRLIANDYSYAIEEEDSDEYIIKFKDKSPYSDFYFNLSQDDVQSGYGFSNVKFRSEFYPGDESIKKNMSVLGDKSEITRLFRSWINLVLSYYDKESSFPSDSIQEQYEEEFLSQFEIIEPDANTHAFSSDKQLIIFKLLDIIEKEIEAVNSKTEHEVEVLNEAKELKRTIPNLTKNKATTALAKFYGHVRRLGLSFGKKIIDKAIDKGIEWFISGKAQGLIDNIHMHF